MVLALKSAFATHGFASVKLLLIGDCGVGKSCVLNRYINDFFDPNFHSTIGVDKARRMILWLDKRVEVEIWDTSGQERFRTIIRKYFRGTMGVVLVYDLTDEDSFDDLHMWTSEVKRHAKEGVPMILVGNKCDLEHQRVVSTKRGQRLADKLGVPFFEVSALDNINIETIFYKLAVDIIEKMSYLTETGQLSVYQADTLTRKEGIKKEIISTVPIDQPASQTMEDLVLISSTASSLPSETYKSLIYGSLVGPFRSLLVAAKDLAKSNAIDSSIPDNENKSSDGPRPSLGINASYIVDDFDDVLTKQMTFPRQVEKHHTAEKVDASTAKTDESSKYWPSTVNDKRCALCKNIHVHEYDFMHYNERTLKASASRGCPVCVFFYDVIVLQSSEIPRQQTPHSQMRITHRDEKLEVFDFSSRLTKFEFYRLQGSPESYGSGTSLREVHPDPNSSACFQIVIDWIMTCVKNHENCNQDSPDAILPTRLIDVSKQRPALVIDTHNINARYIALSYCWGAGNVTTTKTTTIQARRRGIAMDSLPKTLQHAISITRRLKINYLWIDSLCILQDSPGDWQKEAPKMGQYYRNAFLTLSALDSSDANSGMLLPRDNIPSVQIGRNLYLRPESRSWRQVFADAPLSGRAWALQERMVSTRIVHYATDGLFWECLTSSKRESSPVEHTMNHDSMDGLGEDFKRSLFPPTNHSLSREESLRKWYRIIHWYSKLSLTCKEDKLPALSGIAYMTQETISYTYLAGLWKEDLHNGLLWFREARSMSSDIYRAPSWSWACCDGSIDLMFSPTTERTYSEFDAEIVDSWTTCASKDHFGIVEEAVIIIGVLVKDVFYKGSRTNAPYNDDELDLIVDIFDENDLRIGTGYLDHLNNVAPVSADNKDASSESTERKQCCKAIWICERRDKNNTDSGAVVYFLLLVPEPSPIEDHRERYKRIGIGHTQDIFSKEILGDGTFYDCESYIIDLV